MNAIQEFKQVVVAEQFTGCRGAGGYLAYAKGKGYTYVEMLDSTSSAGDWSFLVSTDGHEWFIMFQTNRWPRPGFEYGVDTNVSFYGSLEDVYEQVDELYEPYW